MNPNENEYSPATLRELINNYQKSRIILSAIELDIFSCIGSNSLTSEEISKKIKANTHGTDRLLNALCALQFLKKKNNKFLNTPFSETYLSSSGDKYMYGLMHSVNQWNSWHTLTDAVREGKSVVRRPEKINNRSKQWLESFIGAMHYRASNSALNIAKLIDLTNSKKILDIGGGSGAYVMAMLKNNNDITATVFDLPNVIPITKKYIRKEKFSKRIDTCGGDYLKDEFPEGFDIIFISAVIHINSFEENNDLIFRCKKSLNKGGRIIIQDHIMENDRTSPYPGAIFAINMLVSTLKGDTYTEKDVRSWFKNAGLKFEKRIPVENGNSLIFGIKK